MGMTIEESMKVLQEVPKVMPITKESIDVAISTMRKYQKIKQILNDWENSGEEDDPINIIDNIEEVLENGNDN